jgi:hypothetical protein
MQMEIYWLKNRFTIKLILLILFPLFVYLIPLSSIENSHSICLFKNIFDFNCLGCGITRAILSAIHFDFDKAFQYNKLFIIVLPILCFLYLKNLSKAIIKIKTIL